MSSLLSRARIEKTSDGGYALAGRTNSYGAGLNDYWLLKTDAEGYPEWNVTLGGIEDDRARSLLITDDGGYLVHGWSRSYGAGNLDFWLVKTDEKGNPEWNKTYGGIENERGIPLIKSNDGGYVLAGSTVSYGAGANDFYLVKTDVNGDMIWNRTFGGESGETAGYLLNTVDGGYALVGYTESFGAGNRDIFMVLTDSEGNMVWNKTFGGTETEGVDFCIDTLDGGYLTGGHTQSYGNGEDDYYIIKLNSISQETEPEPKKPGGIPGFGVYFNYTGIDVGGDTNFACARRPFDRISLGHCARCAFFTMRARILDTKEKPKDPSMFLTSSL